ncbi:MAG: HflK protein, partial [Pseudomonadota bacterium]|nr:HflK protein [Pseudomonadota bacterium]
MAGNNGGPWGGGGSSGGSGNRGNNQGGGDDNRGGGGRRPEDPQIPEIDELVKKGQEQLRVLMGGRSGGGNSGGGRGGNSGGGGPMFTKGTVALGALAAAAFWAYMSFYSVKTESRSVELFLGEYSQTGQPGLNFAPWPFVTYEVIPVLVEQTENIGAGGRGSDAG